MFRSILFVGAIVTGVLVVNGPAQADTQKGRCAVVASVHGSKKFVVMKCDRASSPGDYIIRSEAWEHKDRKRYNAMARFAGRRFTCDITFNNTTRRGGMELTNYKLANCR
jgi:hypothetical protein